MSDVEERLLNLAQEWAKWVPFSPSRQRPGPARRLPARIAVPSRQLATEYEDALRQILTTEEVVEG
ncbi:hypothetical protein [Williamsia sp. D3]|uniref:hypothetical protein n=1 Tax=Williamsia sp. D3 TaxID=1313067 RepID=UPI00041298CF|nr:hypothetical protein [Williamsia sp. D3]